MRQSISAVRDAAGQVLYLVVILVFSLFTVKYHISNILGKLGVDNRVSAVTMAIQRKMV